MPRSLIAICGLVLSASIAAAECSAQEKAGGGGVAAGRDIVNSQITIGIPPEQLAGIIEAGRKDLKDLTEHQKHKIDTLEKDLGVNENALQAFFTILGEREVPIDRLSKKLVEIAGHYKEALAQSAPVPNDRPDIARVKSAAKECSWSRPARSRR